MTAKKRKTRSVMMRVPLKFAHQVRRVARAWRIPAVELLRNIRRVDVVDMEVKRHGV